MKLGTSPILKFLTLAIVLTAPLILKADLITMLGNNPQPGDQNVLFATSQTGTSVLGTTNLTNSQVWFSSPTSLTTSGQAVTSALGGNTINSLTITSPGSTFTDVILNPQIAAGTGNNGPFDLTITLVTNTGNFTYSFPTSGKDALGTGQNFITFVAANGTMISQVDLTSTSGFDGLGQIRLSGLVETPEPASLLLLGFGLSAVMIRSRRYRK